MSSSREESCCGRSEQACAYALQALPASEVPEFEAHLASCPHCARELDALGPILETFGDWPSDVQRPAASLRRRLAVRVAQETGGKPVLPDASQWKEPEWKEVAPGISCKLLSTDARKHVVSMLVRLAPGAEYPPHSHAGIEELHLLDGELWIDERKLYPGDYNRAEPGTSDKRVWSETGCTCVLITSTEDMLR